jgi:hypothetical protein
MLKNRCVPGKACANGSDHDFDTTSPLVVRRPFDYAGSRVLGAGQDEALTTAVKPI